MSGMRTGSARRRRWTCTSRPCAGSWATHPSRRATSKRFAASGSAWLAGLARALSRVRLRTGLQAALAYVLLLAVVALGIPLAVSLKTRVNDEVRSQAQGQADLVAATASDLSGPTRRKELGPWCGPRGGGRGRVLVVDARGTVIADSAGPREIGASFAPARDPGALRGHPVQLQRTSRTLGEELLATRGSDHPQQAHHRRDPRHPERRLRAVGRHTGRARPWVDRRRRAGSGSARSVP